MLSKFIEIVWPVLEILFSFLFFSFFLPRDSWDVSRFLVDSGDSAKDSRDSSVTVGVALARMSGILSGMPWMLPI